MAKRNPRIEEPANQRVVQVQVRVQDPRGAAFGYARVPELSFRVSGEVPRGLCRKAREMFQQNFSGLYVLMDVKYREGDEIECIVRHPWDVPNPVKEEAQIAPRPPASGRRYVAKPGRKQSRLLKR